MKSVSPILLVALAVSTPLAQAQFGSGIVYDPTQSAHAVQQIQKLDSFTQPPFKPRRR